MKGRRLGVRWSRPGLDAALRELVPAALGPGHAPPVISIVVGGADGPSRSKHQVHVHGRLVAATTDENRLMRTVARLIANLGADRPEGTLSLRAFGVLSADESVTIVDSRLRDDVRRMEPRLRRIGANIIDLTEAWVRTAEGTCVLPDCADLLNLDVPMFNERWPNPGDGDDFAGGSRKIDRLIYCGHPDVPTSAAAVAQMVPMLLDATSRVATSAVEAMSEFASLVPTRALPIGDRTALRELLDEDSR